jgi:SAM-dependent methyltransferase
MSLLVPPRRPSREWLDDPDLPCEEMRRSLEDIASIHRSWRASRALVRHLTRRIRTLGHSDVSILDVGAGGGDVGRGLEARLSASGCRVRVAALDLQWRHLAAGRRRTIPREAVCADAFRLPFADGAFDFAVSTLFFHHFSPEQNRSLLAEIGRVARHGFAMLDLRRHIVPALFLGAAGPLLFRSRTSWHDGVASVRQAYTPEEALEVARGAAPGSRATRVFPFGLLITADR